MISWVFSTAWAAWAEDAGASEGGDALQSTSPSIRYSIVQRAIRITRCKSTFGAGKSNTGIAAVCCEQRRRLSSVLMAKLRSRGGEIQGPTSFH